MRPAIFRSIAVVFWKSTDWLSPGTDLSAKQTIILSNYSELWGAHRPACGN
jgi:hypothetical protein